jgi:hypothetical protein
VAYVLSHEDDKAPLQWSQVRNLVTKDIRQWLLVSEHLYLQLIKYGEAGTTDKKNFYWGRQHIGKPVFDPVITSICADMQILEGQRFEWK